jgi:hypothetical protein
MRRSRLISARITPPHDPPNEKPGDFSFLAESSQGSGSCQGKAAG